jgi:superfamily II DNA or RNA helicase
VRPQFGLGSLVQRYNAPEEIGVVRSMRWSEQVEIWEYSVQFGAQLRALDESSLRPIIEAHSPWDFVRAGRVSGADHLISLLTFHRLRRPPARIAFSFATSRTQFYPHQFKPLLKFLDNPQQRLLIADEVGLGKTIEAGYVLRELRAQRPVDRVFVVVPARLGPKWKREMASRFQEPFDIVSKRDVLALTENIRRGVEPPSFRWIATYESIRPEEVRDSLESTAIPIDLLIVDEAHRAKNLESLQHKAVRVLCDSAEAVLFLSATPVQNKLEELWVLLRMLAPEEFSSWWAFENLMRDTRHVLRAQHHLATSPPDIDNARDALRDFLASRTGQTLAGQPAVRNVLSRLDEGVSSRRDLVELTDDIGRLSALSHVLTRTRKVDAIPNRPRRIAHWHSVPLTPQERTFYDLVAGLCLLLNGIGSGSEFALLMAYRMTASCIPAAARYFAERLRGATPPSLFDELDDGEDDGEQKGEGGLLGGELRRRIEQAVQGYHFDRDSKLEHLVEILRSLAPDPTGRLPKTVVFSYFKRTLSYLADQLESRGLSPVLIHGDVAIDDREVAIDRFLKDPQVSVLLSSEVGGEGIDLQEASIVINYDLPWNPMVVEQRIGRLDRIGQESPVIVIRNLVIENSIEERVLKRLLDKIGIFRDSIGELDPIIGERIESLAISVLSGDVPASLIDEQVRGAGDAIESQVSTARTMLNRLEGMLSVDQALEDEIAALVGERQVPADSEVLLFINRWLAHRYPGLQIPERSRRDGVEVDLRGTLLADLQNAGPDLAGDLTPFIRRASTGLVPLTASREFAYRHPRFELLSLGHPLVRYAVHQIAQDSGASAAAFALRLRRSAVLPSGLYGFEIAVLEIHSSRERTRVASTFCALPDGPVWNDQDETARVLVELLGQAVSDTLPGADCIRANATEGRLAEAMALLRAEITQREQRVAALRAEQQMASFRSAVAVRLQRAMTKLEGLQARGGAEFSIRMAMAQMDKARRELDNLADTTAQRPVTVEHLPIAAGVLRVEAGP